MLPQTVTFFVDQTFQTALLFMLGLGQFKVIALSQEFALVTPNYSSCRVSKADGAML